MQHQFLFLKTKEKYSNGFPLMGDHFHNTQLRSEEVQ